MDLTGGSDEREGHRRQPVSDVELCTTQTWEALGTTVVLRYADRPTLDVRAAVQAEIDAIDSAASRFRETPSCRA